ncbi:phage tail assembly protein [Lacibacterium aquatile]|uniref:Phage tail assembly protein n=1 Tax=Lacibacterium aquatile TaxID=1168082 RepID=A0ABW5DT92_9PROT
MSDTITYTLQYPFQFTASRWIDQLVFQTEPKVRDLKRLDHASGGIEAGIVLLSVLSGEPVDLIEALKASDYVGASKLVGPTVAGFLGAGAH